MVRRVNTLFALVLLISGTLVQASAHDTLWTRSFGGLGADEALSVEGTHDGGAILAGYNSTDIHTAESGPYLVRIDASGGLVWERTYGQHGGGVANYAKELSRSGFVAVGSVRPPGREYHDIYLMQTDENGNCLREEVFGGEDDELGMSLDETTDGGYILAGYSTAYGLDSKCHALLIRTDAMGDTVWTRTYGGRDHTRPRSVRQTRDGGFIVTGSNLSMDDENLHVFLLKVDSGGDSLWMRNYGPKEVNEAHCVCETYPDGGYIVAGSVRNGLPPWEEDMYVLHTNRSGEPVWEWTHGGAGTDVARSVRQTFTDGGFMIAGQAYSRDGSYFNAYVMKMGPTASGSRGVSLTATQPSPNPFVESTRISFEMSTGGRVCAGLYDIRGRRVVSLLEREMPGGYYDIILDATSPELAGTGAGVYFLKLEAGDKSLTRKVVMAR